MDDLERGDTTRASVVAIGGDYNGPIDTDRIVILVLDGHPKDEEEWMDRAKNAQADMGFTLPDNGYGMMGHRRFDMIRGTVRVRLNLAGTGGRAPVKGEAAMEIRQTVLPRVRHILDTDTSLAGFFDEYDGTVQIFNVSRVQTIDLQGGNSDSYVDWTALVTVPVRQRSTP